MQKKKINMSSFQKFMITPEFFLVQDPVGFNREKFQNELNIEMLDFVMKVK